MNLILSLPSWLDMDQPVEAAIAAIVFFLVAGYFLRGRPEAPPTAAPAPAAPPPQPAALAPPAPTPAPAPAVEPVPTMDPAFQTYLAFLSGLRDPTANSTEATQRAAHWSD